MTFDEALALAKTGKAIRTPDMGDGWCFLWHEPHQMLYARNPVTGSLTSQSPAQWQNANNWYDVAS